MAIDYEDLATKLSIAVKESVRSVENAKRIWEIYIQCSLFDPKDQMYNFSLYSGLPDSVVRAYLEVCRKFQADMAVTRRPAKSGN